MRKLKALLFQLQADERISFAEDFSEDVGGVVLGMPRSKPTQRRPSMN